MIDMTNTQPASLPLTGPNAVPAVTLNGIKWPVPLLASRQNRIVVPLLMKLSEKFGGGFVISALDQEAYDDLLKVVYTGLTRAHPALSWEEFLDWPILAEELTGAFVLIGEQTGMTRRKTYGEPDAGEALAGTPSQTGTE